MDRISDRPADDASAASAAVSGQPPGSPRRSAVRTRRALRWLALAALAVALYALLGYVALPRLAHEPLARRLSEELSRPVGIGRLEFDPFLLRLRVHQLSVAQAPGAPDRGELAGFDELEVDLSSRSLLRLAPVVSSLRIEQPRIRLQRDAQGRYSIEDLLEKWRVPSAEPKQTLRYSVSNIVVNDGRLEFDDALRRVHHEIEALALRVPFVSSLPVDEAVHVEPHLSASLDGAPMQLDVRALPFRTPGDWAADIELQPLDLARFAAYLPDALPGPPAVELRSGRLGATLRITASLPSDGTPTIAVRGRSTLSDLQLAEPGGAPLFAAGSIDLDGIELDWPQNRYAVGRVAIAGARLTASRRSGETRFFETVLGALERNRSSGDGDGASAPPAQWGIGEVVLTGGQVAFADERFEPKPLKLRVQEIDATLRAIGSDVGRAAQFEASAALAEGEKLQASGTLVWQTGAVDAKVKLGAVALQRWWWIVEPQFALDVVGGTATIDARLRTMPLDGAPLSLRIDDGTLRVRDLSLRQRWDRRTLIGLPQVDVEGVALDLAQRTAQIASLRAQGGRLLVRREADARLNLQRVFEEEKGEGGREKGNRQGAGPWKVELARLAIDGFGLDVQDEAAGKMANLGVEAIAVQASGLSSAAGAPPARVAARANVDRRGILELDGQVALDPIDATLHVKGRNLGIVALQPYFTGYFDAIVSSGAAGFDGNLRMTVPKDATPRLSYRGRASVVDFAARTRTGNRDLLRWKALSVDGIDVGSAPTRIQVGDIALSGLRSRLIINREGRFNLQDVLVDRKSSSKEAAPGSSSRQSDAGPGPLARIGAVRLTDGDIDFSDFFVRPNYSANLTGLSGGISRIERDRPGEVDLRGRIDHTGSVEIRGQINPLGESLFLDIRADARDIDLPRLSPYSAKYVGYGIDKGKLSAKVEYKLANRELTAQNAIVLDQLTFGEKVESPDAIRLPVLFAVSLLKDRNGVIDVNLPIGGSLDDPQFSIGGIVMRLIGSLIVKAVTSPFALIANLAGAGGDAELSWLGFEPGSADLDPATQKKLDSIAKALTDRPALKLDVAGRADPASDRAALRKRALERALKSQKQKESGGSADSAAIEAVTIDPQEYPKYLELAWRAGKFDKPRNRLGMLEKLPPEQMERMLLEHMQVGDARLTRLADDRAQRVKDRLADSGISAERIFIVGSKISDAAPAGPSPGGIDPAAGAVDASVATSAEQTAGTAPTTRVDLSLK